MIWLHHPSTSASEAAGSDAAPVVADMVLAVPDARWSPVMQYYVTCRFPNSISVDKRKPYKIHMPPEFPVLMEMAVGHPRMDAYTRLWRSLGHFLSDEIAQEMLLTGQAHEWQLIPLVWQLPDKCTDLLKLEILDVKPIISSARVASKTVVAEDMWKKEFDGVNPFSDAASHGGDFAVGASGTGGPADDMSEREEHSDTDMMAGVGFDHDALEHAEELAKEASDLWEAEPPAEGEEPLAEGEGGAAATEEDVAMLFTSDSESVSAALVETTVAERVAACVVTGYGNVTCPLAPFTEVPRLGRLAERNLEKPAMFRTIEVVCSVHTGKGVRCQFARVRTKLSDHDWLTWLVQAQPLPEDASFEQRRDAAKAHGELFHVLFP